MWPGARCMRCWRWELIGYEALSCRSRAAPLSVASGVRSFFLLHVKPATIWLRSGRRVSVSEVDQGIQSLDLAGVRALRCSALGALYRQETVYAPLMGLITRRKLKEEREPCVTV
jgi:hypothetical protein